MKNWCEVIVASLSCQISAVPNQEDTPNLRNESEESKSKVQFWVY